MVLQSRRLHSSYKFQFMLHYIYFTCSSKNYYFMTFDFFQFPLLVGDLMVGVWYYCFVSSLFCTV
jgi:hypothetical protein